MARQINIVNTSTDTFQVFIDRTNDIINLTNTVIITTNTGNGDITSGNAFVNGVFGANTLVTSTIRAGNVSNSAATILINSNVSVNASMLSIGNATVNSSISASEIFSSGDLTLQGLANVSGTIASGNSTVTGFINVSSTANVGGAVNLRSTLDVNGAVTVANAIASGNSTVTGFINVSSTANVGGAVNLRSTLAVNGTVTIANSIQVLSGNLIINASAGIIANGSIGTSGQTLLSNGSSVYWGNAAVGEISTTSSNTNILYNSSGAIEGSNGLSFNFTTNTISIGNSVSNLVANSTIIRLANSTSNISISIPTTTESNGSYFLNGNGQWSSPTVGSVSPAGANTEVQFNDSGALGANSRFTFNKVSGALSAVAINLSQSHMFSTSSNTSGTSQQQVDIFSYVTYRGAEYLITVKDNNSNSYQISKLLLIHDDGTSYVTEYGIIVSNTITGSLGTFDSSISGSDVLLLFTPTVSNTTMKIVKTTITV